MQQNPAIVESISCRDAAALIVCERTGHWAGWLRAVEHRTCLSGSPPGENLPIAEVRSAAECVEQLWLAPASFIAVELTAASCDAALELLLAIDARFPRARTAVVASRELHAYEWLARELGAVEFLTSPRRIETLVAAARAHLRGLPRTNPSIAERIWAELPWSA